MYFLLLNLIGSFSSQVHKKMGNMYYTYANNSTLTLLKEKLDNENIGIASTWPDKIKHKPKWKWTKQLHYIDAECNGKFIDKQNLLWALKQTENLNKKSTTKFHLHFIQDAMQPFHTLGKYRGGNNFKIIIHINNNKKINSNMHFLWDSYMPLLFFKRTIKGFFPLNLKVKNWKEIIKDTNKLACLVKCKHNIQLASYYLEHEWIMIEIFRNFLTIVIYKTY